MSLVLLSLVSPSAEVDRVDSTLMQMVKTNSKPPLFSALHSGRGHMAARWRESTLVVYSTMEL